MTGYSIRFRRLAAALALVLPASLVAPQLALAAGYDTPMLYSARHMGMGGAAISYVDDPSAIFHNPAGLANLKGGAVFGDFSPLVGGIHGSPSDTSVTGTSGSQSQPGMNIGSERTFAPFFLVGAGYRLHKLLSVGFAAYPVASAGADYKYSSNVAGPAGTLGEVTDHTKLVFLEFAPSIAVQILEGLNLGVAYRYSTIEFQRSRTNSDLTGASPSRIDLDMAGKNAAGLRVGLQYVAKMFQLGLVYRNQTDTTVKTAKGVLTNVAAENVEYGFTLPSKVGLGAQFTGIDKLRLALDAEYTWQSVNTQTGMVGIMGGALASQNIKVGPVYNVMNWDNNMTVRAGAAYQIGPVEARCGYVHDGQASQAKYPSAFGTPPAVTQVYTVGAGYKISDALDVSLAGAYRTGKATVTAADVAGNNCPFCGFAGTYEINLFGAYVDVLWRFGGKDKAAAAPAPVAAPAADLAPASLPAPAPAVEPAPAPSPVPAPGLPQR